MKDIILQYIQQHIPEFAENNLPIQIETPPSEEMGDFAVACFPLARTMKQAPNMIAETLAERLQSVEGIIVKNTGPYLNFFIGDALLVENLSKQDTCKQTEKNKKVMVEYSSPNTNKPQHLGHVRNNIIGMAMSSILSHTGYDVVKCNLYNDRGIAICKSMIAYQYLGNGETPESSGTKGDHLVGKYYVLYKELCKKEGEEKIEAETSEMLRKWEAGDRETRQLWQTMTDWVLTGYDQTYQTLGCQFDAIYKESDTYMDGKDIIQEGLEKGIFQTKENGAVFADLSEYKLDEKILQRGDGTSIYITQDLGTTLRKFNEHNLDSATWVVANEQDYHFKVLFALIDKLGYKDMTKSCHHLSYGYIQLPNGRMKSREGTVIDADSLIAELQELCKDAIQSRNLELEEWEVQRRANILAIASLKFYILQFNADSDFVFNPEESIKLEGKTGPYILYAYARIQSIFRKLDTNQTPTMPADIQLSATEKSLMKLLIQYQDITTAASDKYDPAILTKYLYEVAKTFNGFYRDNKIMNISRDTPAGVSLQQQRIYIADKTATVLKNGLALLGIDVLDTM